MPRRSAAVVLTVLLATTSCARARRPRSEVWTVADDAPCAGLTLGWPAPIAELRELVGPGLEPAPGPAPGSGLVLLFVARCPGSTIDGRPTGPFVTAHTIVPLEPPAESRGEPGRDAQGWITLADTYAPDGNPVRALLHRHGFRVQSGTATLDLTPHDGGEEVHLLLTTRGGQVDATATFADSAHALDRVTGMVSPGAGTRSLVLGPERSRRITGRDVHVAITGNTPLAGLHLGGGTPGASLDTAFAWSFAFDPTAARIARH